MDNIVYANQMLRTIVRGLAPAGTKFRSTDGASYEDPCREMTLVAITGIEDPLRVGVREAVTTCYHAGVAA